MPQLASTTFDALSLDGVLAAASRCDASDLPEGLGTSRRHDILHGAKRYPPKAVVALALEGRLGRCPGGDEFDGEWGKPALRRLRGLGIPLATKPGLVADGHLLLSAGVRGDDFFLLIEFVDAAPPAAVYKQVHELLSRARAVGLELSSVSTLSGDGAREDGAPPLAGKSPVPATPIGVFLDGGAASSTRSVFRSPDRVFLWLQDPWTESLKLLHEHMISPLPGRGASAVEEERRRRLDVWARLRDYSEGGDGRELTAEVVNEARAFFGGRGIWRDKSVTAPVSGDTHGVTVGLLHTGRHYEDDLDESGGFYYYPVTKNAGVDRGDVEATKNCLRLGLPLFIVRKPAPSSRRRNVGLGWVVGWDDEGGYFLIETSAEEPPPPPAGDGSFEIYDPKSKRGGKSFVPTRPEQRRFKLAVFRRYGAKCAVSGLEVKEMLDAAHIVPKSERGSDDPRNGLVLSASLHRAYDRGLWAIHPETLEIVARPGGPSLEAMGVRHMSLAHHANKPHRAALQWAWEHSTKDWEEVV